MKKNNLLIALSVIIILGGVVIYYFFILQPSRKIQNLEVKTTQNIATSTESIPYVFTSIQPH
ncbi:MAG: hypothetical protein ACP5IC_02835, partial [Minisyncoccia bacterium]